MHVDDVKPGMKVLVPLTVDYIRVDEKGRAWVSGGSEEMQYSSDFDIDTEGRMWARAELLRRLPEGGEYTLTVDELVSVCLRFLKCTFDVKEDELISKNSWSQIMECCLGKTFPSVKGGAA